MAAIDLIRSCLDSIRQIADEIVDAVVFLDSGCVEAFEMIDAFPLLLELRARAVCGLENMSPLDIVVDYGSTFLDPPKKTVFITTRLLSDAHRFILRCLATHRNVLHCTIFTSISEMAHSAYVESPLGPDAFHEYEALLLQDYEELVKKDDNKGLSSDEQNEIWPPQSGHHEKSALEDDGWSQLASSDDYDSTVAASSAGRQFCDESNSCMETRVGHTKLLVSVHHLPLIFCPLSPRVFVFPSEGTIAEARLSNDNEESLSPGLPSICNGLPSDGEDVPPGVTLTAHFLYHLAAKMDLKIEIFSLGDTSRTIGKMLTDMSSLYDVGRRNRRTAGLLLIDRTLDLLTPCCHGDSLVDRILSSLPQRERNRSSLHVRSLQIPNKLSSANVQHSPLDAIIPFEKIFNKEEHARGSSQLAESVSAFMSGWTCPEIAKRSDSVENVHINNLDNALNLLGGSIFSNQMGANYLEALLNTRAKDGAMLIKNWLLQALQHEKVALNPRGRLGFTSASELHAMVSRLSSNEASLIRNRGIIQLALAAEIALSEPHSSRWDAFVSAERILSISSGDTSQSLSTQIRDLINTSVLVRTSGESSQGLLSFQDALLLSMIGYILAGESFRTSGLSSPFSWEEEHSLKEAVVDAILEKPAIAKFKFLHGLEKELEANSMKEEPGKGEQPFSEPSKIDDFDDQWGSWDDDDTDTNNERSYGNMQLKLELRDRVDHLFKFFHKLSGLKWKNPAFRGGLMAAGSSLVDDAYTRKGLLYKILSTVLAKYEIPGLEYHSSAVGRLLKSGFGRFGLGQAKPSFGDQNILLVFVVGGINSLEACEAIEAVSESSRPDVELILGGNTLLTPDDMFDLLLGSSSYQ